HLEYSVYEALVAADILRTVRRAEEQGYDAAVIGCFYDPFLYEARELSGMVVTAPAESSMALAMSLGTSFSIVVGRTKWVPQMRENVQRYGMSERLVSFESVDMGVLEFQREPRETEKRIVQAARRAVEKGAEVIILGCTIEFGFYRQVQEEVGVPVVDAVLAPFKHAEFLAEVRKRTGISHSRKGRFEPSPESEWLEWGIRV
ncbi:aspartate/glutamate racemase family protein, partial [Thermogymnomonas acidicola]